MVRYCTVPHSTLCPRNIHRTVATLRACYLISPAGSTRRHSHSQHGTRRQRTRGKIADCPATVATIAALGKAVCPASTAISAAASAVQHVATRCSSVCCLAWLVVVGALPTGTASPGQSCTGYSSIAASIAVRPRITCIIGRATTATASTPHVDAQRAVNRHRKCRCLGLSCSSCLPRIAVRRGIGSCRWFHQSGHSGCWRSSTRRGSSASGSLAAPSSRTRRAAGKSI